MIFIKNVVCIGNKDSGVFINGIQIKNEDKEVFICNNTFCNNTVTKSKELNHGNDTKK